MNRIFNIHKNQNKPPLLVRRLLSPQPSFDDESLYKEEDIMLFPAISLLPTKRDLAPKPLVRTKSCDSFSTITTAEETPGESCGIKKMPVRQQSSSVLANALLPLEISFPNKPLPPMPRHLMEKARSIPERELEEDYFEEDDEISFPNKPLPPMPRHLMEKARHIPEPELEEDYFEKYDDDFEEDDDDDDQAEIVFLPDDHLPPSVKTTRELLVPPPLNTQSRKMESDPEPEEPCRDRPAFRRAGPSLGLLQDLCVPARSFEPVRTLPSSAGQVLQQRDLCVPARSFEPELLDGARFEI
jgi:hypothetical protein